MSATLESSSSDTHNQSSGQNAGPAVFPSVQQILDTHYSEYATDPRQYRHLIKDDHTTKASLISDAVNKGYITHEFHPYLLCVLVEPLHIPFEGDSIYLPVVMCIDEGSYDDFSKELSRLFKQGSEKLVEIEMKFTDDISKAVAGDGWGDIARALLKDKAKVAMIRVGFGSPGAE